MSSEETPIAAARPEGSARPAAPDANEGQLDRLELKDPAVMRALAHPLRWALLEALLHAGTLTATQAGEILGETPANCAFHLRTLARYGLVEEAGGGKGRERPWRRVVRVFNMTIAHDDPQAAAAADVLDEFWTTQLLNRATAALRRKRSWPAEWLANLGESQTISYLTSAEAEELQEVLLAALHRYRDRTADPSLRPPGAMPIEYLVLSYPLLDLASRPVPADPSWPADPAPATGQQPATGQEEEEEEEEEELPS
jgi:hypothetical protein